jgi:SAM-dependent methyltransferase
VPDPCYDDPRLAAVYDALDPDRTDLDAYVAVAHEFGARRVVDIGCGTGTLAVRLARLGLDVVGIDPAAASVEVARRKPQALLVRWIVGDAPSAVAELAGFRADLAVMTANVAQVFVTDDEWLAALRAAHQLLTPDGRLVFETRVPARRAWERWNGPGADVEVPGVGRVSDSYEVLTVEELDLGDLLVTFSSPTRFHGQDPGADDVVIDSVSTLRFRTRESLIDSLRLSGFRVDEFRGAPDRPRAEWVVVARPVG